MAKKKTPAKNPPGSPPFYRTPEEFEKKVKEYVKMCEGEPILSGEGLPIFDKHGNMVTTGKNPTVSGLAYFMGFASRQSMYDQEKREGFSYVVSRAKLFIESSYEEDTRKPGVSPSGPTFVLRNMGWSDKQELQLSTIDENGESTGFNFVDPPGEHGNTE